MKSIFFSKTIIVAILQGILGVVVAVGTQIPTIGWLIVVKSVVDIILRFLTEEPVSLKSGK